MTLLTIDALSAVSLRDNNRPVLSDVSLTLAPGEVRGL
ncbi:MAG: ABC transporter ATP-binding protein, partial [Martelella sp.]